MKRAGLKAAGLSDITGIPPEYISNYLNDKKTPCCKTIVALSVGLNLYIECSLHFLKLGRYNLGNSAEERYYRCILCLAGFKGLGLTVDICNHFLEVGGYEKLR